MFSVQDLEVSYGRARSSGHLVGAHYKETVAIVGRNAWASHAMKSLIGLLRNRVRVDSCR